VLGDFPLQVTVNLYVGAACIAAGEIGQAEEHLENTVRLLEGDRVRERFGLHGFPAAIARSYLAWALAERGDFDGAIARGQEGVDIADAAHHAYSLAYVCWGLAVPHVVRGDLVEAARVLERATSLCREWNLPLIGSLVSGLLGLARARSGRVADGVALLQEAVASHELTFGSGVWHSLNVTWLGEALLLSNRLDEAQSVAERSLALTRKFKHRICEPWALRLLGEIASRRDVPDGVSAEGFYRQALALAEELGMRPLVACCHLGFAKHYRRAGMRCEAHEHLTTAATLCREMNMPGWLQDVEAEMRHVV
jgi:tetratricopeptide (TPR) repeat protein